MYLVLPHTFPIVFSMGMIWFHTIAKPWECCVYCTIPSISMSSKQRAIWYGNVLTLLHHSHIISLAYYCWYGNVMGGDKAPYHSHIIQAYSHWYGITMGGKTPPSRRKNGIWWLWKKNGCAVNFIILYYLCWCIIILETLKMESKMQKS